MEKSYSESYAAAGVDITAGYRSVELMKQYVARTMNEHCIGGLGGFGGLFELDCTGYKHPVLISGTDGVGTKLKIAMILDKHTLSVSLKLLLSRLSKKAFTSVTTLYIPFQAIGIKSSLGTASNEIAVEAVRCPKANPEAMIGSSCHICPYAPVVVIYP